MWDKVEKALAYQEQDTAKAEDKTFEKLTVTNLAYQTSDQVIFKDVNFELNPGEKVLLMAPRSWGKTTLLRNLIGQLAPNQGTVQIDKREW